MVVLLSHMLDRHRPVSKTLDLDNRIRSGSVKIPALLNDFCRGW